MVVHVMEACPEYKEWEHPAGPPAEHFLNLITKRMDEVQAGAGNAVNVEASEHADCPHKSVRVFACLNIHDIHGIDSVAESFTVKVRMYLAWQPRILFEGEGDSSASDSSDSDDGQTDGQQRTVRKLKALAAQSHASGKNVGLSDADCISFSEHVPMPTLKFGNAYEIENHDDIPSVRIYGQGEFVEKPLVLWNKGYLLTLKENFELRDFPFDLQELQVELRQDDSRTWDQFDLTIMSVQFHKNALQLAEWTLVEPIVKKVDSTVSTAILRVSRRPQYYLLNIVVIMDMLSVLGLTVFALPNDDLASRQAHILTLILTAVAFKFVISDSMPKIGYNTLLDDFVLGNFFFLFMTALLATGANFLIYESGVETVMGISTNRAAGWSSLILLVVVNAVWFFRVRAARWSQAHGFDHYARPMIAQPPERNWYCCIHANPAFMPQPRVSRDTNGFSQIFGRG